MPQSLNSPTVAICSLNTQLYEKQNIPSNCPSQHLEFIPEPTKIKERSGFVAVFFYFFQIISKIVNKAFDKDELSKSSKLLESW